MRGVRETDGLAAQGVLEEKGGSETAFLPVTVPPDLPPEWGLARYFLMENAKFFPLIFWSQGFGDEALLKQVVHQQFTRRMHRFSHETLGLLSSALSMLMEDVLGEEEHQDPPARSYVDPEALSARERQIQQHRARRHHPDNAARHFARSEHLLQHGDAHFLLNETLRNWQNNLIRAFKQAEAAVFARVEQVFTDYPGFYLLDAAQLRQEREGYAALIRSYRERCTAYYLKRWKAAGRRRLEPLEAGADEEAVNYRDLFGQMYCDAYPVYLVHTLMERTAEEENSLAQENTAARHHGLAAWLFSTPLAEAEWPAVWQDYLQKAPQPVLEYSRALAYLAWCEQQGFISEAEKSAWETNVHTYYRSVKAGILQAQWGVWRYRTAAAAAAYSAEVTADLRVCQDLLWSETWVLQQCTNAEVFAQEYRDLQQRLKPVLRAMGPSEWFPGLQPAEARWRTDWRMCFHDYWLALQLRYYPELRRADIPLRTGAKAGWRLGLQTWMHLLPDETLYHDVLPPEDPDNNHWRGQLEDHAAALPAFFHTLSTEQCQTGLWVALLGYTATMPQAFAFKERLGAYAQMVAAPLNSLGQIQGRPLVVETLDRMASQGLLLRTDETGQTLMHCVMSDYPNWLARYAPDYNHSALLCQDKLLALCFQSNLLAKNAAGKTPVECLPDDFTQRNLREILEKTVIQSINETQNGYAETCTEEMHQYVRAVMEAVWGYLAQARFGEQATWREWLRRSPQRLEEAFQYLVVMLQQDSIANAVQFEPETAVEAVREEASTRQLRWRVGNSQLHGAVKQLTAHYVSTFRQQRAKIAGELWRKGPVRRLSEANEVIAALAQEVKTAQQQTHVAEAKAQQREGENAALTQEKAVLAEANTALTQENAALIEQLAASHRETAEAKLEAKAATDQVKALQDKLEASNQRTENAEREAAEAKLESAEAKLEAKAATDQVKALKDELKASNQRNKQEMHDLKTGIHDLIAQAVQTALAHRSGTKEADEPRTAKAPDAVQAVEMTVLPNTARGRDFPVPAFPSAHEAESTEPPTSPLFAPPARVNSHRPRAASLPGFFGAAFPRVEAESLPRRPASAGFTRGGA